MQKIAFFLVTALIAYGCASSKKAADISIGTWEYVIKDTPEGDASGTFTIAKEGDNYTGTLNGSQGSTPINGLSIGDGNLSGTFDYSGYELMMTGTFEGTSFTGNISVEGYDFPMAATKME